MAQFDVYENTNSDTAASVPYLLDVQADLLSNLATRVVVPLVAISAIERATHLNPRFDIGETPVVMSTAELVGVSRNVLGKKVASLKEHRDEILHALDFLFTGF